MIWAVCIVGAYLVGSIPFGYLIGRSRGVDIRRGGSGNVGATNVGRLLGRRLGLVCFLLDAGKGAGPVAAAGAAAGVWGRSATGLAPAESWLWLLVAAAALGGHIASPWLGFKGGKGVATGFGGMIAMWPLLTVPALVGVVVWGATMAATRIVSLSSMIAAVSLPLSALAVAVVPALTGGERGAFDERLMAHAPIIVTTAALAVFVIYKHRANIARLRAGEEPRVGR